MVKFLVSVAFTINKTQTHMLTTLAFGGDTAASICGAMAQVRCTHTHTHTHTQSPSVTIENVKNALAFSSHCLHITK